MFDTRNFDSLGVFLEEKGRVVFYKAGSQEPLSPGEFKVMFGTTFRTRNGEEVSVYDPEKYILKLPERFSGFTGVEIVGKK